MNHLASEKSPYLLQHAANPVDWYPWGEEAFALARTADKPIFLSVGYSTCHWCHVMEHESFENADIARLLNEHFVSIKVDREERPDVDRFYMTFVQATTGGGGWPMSVWLTPGLEPIYGGTYFPPVSRWGRPGLADVVREIARLWREEREQVLRSAATIRAQLAQAAAVTGGEAVPGEAALARAVNEFGRAFDGRAGGFGGAPKFPRPSELLFLLREYHRGGDHDALDMVLATLRAMAGGGVRDQVGGGFHRYSVDAEWRVPHFEKMLYDQAQLVLAYLEAAQAAGDPMLVDVAEDTLRYVRREMTGPGGGFYSAEDADSLPPGAEPGAGKQEGAFYLWTAEEIDALLGDEADVVKARFGVRPGGNALQDPQGEFEGKNILYVARPPEMVARDCGREVDQVWEILRRSRQRLFEARSRRPRPHLDDKVLTAWNGLMIAAFARASRLVRAFRSDADARGDAEGHLDAARRAAAFIRDHMWEAESGRLLRRYRDGEAAIGAYAEDYACLVFGLIELFEADGDPQWLEWAVRLQQRQDDLFWDPVEGGWFGTGRDDASLALRIKEDYDGAEPAASSVSVLNLLRLGHLTGVEDAAGKVERTLRLFASRIDGMPRAVPMMLAALSTYHAGIRQVVIVTGEAGDATPLRQVVDRRYLPFAWLVPPSDSAGGGETLARLLPAVSDMRARDGRATAYVCQDFACQEPTTDPERLAQQLKAPKT